MAWGASDVGAGVCGWSFVNGENRHILAHVVSCHPQSSTDLVVLSTITAALLYMTEQTLSQRGPIPIRLSLKVGMMCPWRKVSCRRGMVQYYTNLCVCPIGVPTKMGGTLLLRSPQGESLIIYIPLAPASVIAVSLG